MDIFICILKTIAGYFILLIAGTNLLGLVIRGIVPTYRKDGEGNLFITENIASNGSIIMTTIFFVITILYFYALYHYWNTGILVAGLIAMIARIPDLLFEMKTGEKVNLKNMRKKRLDIILSILSWLTFPLIWYSLCYFK